MGPHRGSRATPCGLRTEEICTLLVRQIESRQQYFADISNDQISFSFLNTYNLSFVYIIVII